MGRLLILEGLLLLEERGLSLRLSLHRGLLLVLCLLVLLLLLLCHPRRCVLLLLGTRVRHPIRPNDRLAPDRGSIPFRLTQDSATAQHLLAEIVEMVVEVETSRLGSSSEGSCTWS